MPALQMQMLFRLASVQSHFCSGTMLLAEAVAMHEPNGLQ